MKGIIVCALLCVVPFAGVRVVCFNADTAARQEAALRQQAAAAQEQCERVCSRTHRVQQAPARPTCALVADPTCGFLVDAIVAVMPAPLLSPASVLISPVDANVSASYVPPSLARFTPPPKA